MTITRTAKAIGDLFRAKRESEGCSLRHIGKNVGIDWTLIARVERGENKISLENFIRLCEYYGFNLAKLVETHTVRDKRGRII